MKNVSLNRKPLRISSQVLVVLMWAIFSNSLIFAAVVKDKDSHLVFEKGLREMLSMEKAVSKSIAHNDIALLREQLESLESEIRKAQASVDRALLLGAWSSAEVKQRGHALVDRLETLKILNFMGLAFSSDYYKNPTKKVSASVKDSVDRFFVELKLLADGVTQTNQGI